MGLRALMIVLLPLCSTVAARPVVPSLRHSPTPDPVECSSPPSALQRPMATMPSPLALIAGASSGIGAIFARTLVRAVMTCCLSRPRRNCLEALAEELHRAHTIRAEVFPVDLATDAGIDGTDGKSAVPMTPPSSLTPASLLWPLVFPCSHRWDRRCVRLRSTPYTESMAARAGVVWNDSLG